MGFTPTLNTSYILLDIEIQTHLPCRPGPGPVFCSPAPPLDILSAYRTFPAQNKQTLVILQPGLRRIFNKQPANATRRADFFLGCGRYL